MGTGPASRLTWYRTWCLTWCPSPFWASRAGQHCLSRFTKPSPWLSSHYRLGFPTAGWEQHLDAGHRPIAASNRPSASGKARGRWVMGDGDGPSLPSFHRRPVDCPDNVRARPRMHAPACTPPYARPRMPAQRGCLGWTCRAAARRMQGRRRAAGPPWQGGQGPDAGSAVAAGARPR